MPQILSFGLVFVVASVIPGMGVGVGVGGVWEGKPRVQEQREASSQDTTAFLQGSSRVVLRKDGGFFSPNLLTNSP